MQAGKRQAEEYQRSVGEALRTVRRIARSLVAAGVSPDERYFRGMTFKKPLFGQAKRVDDPARDKYGWYVGTYQWSVEAPDIYGARRVIRRLRTFVTESGDLAAEGDPQMSQPRTQESYLSLGEVASVQGESTNPPTEAELWGQIADIMAKLAQQRGVSVAAN